MKALVVDDEKLVRSVVRSILSTEGFDVDEAQCFTSGLEALANAQVLHEPYHLLITDYDYKDPKGNGYDLLRRATLLNSKPRTILASGWPPDGLPELVRSIGAFYLQKPYGMAHLIDTVKTVLNDEKYILRPQL